MESTMEVVLFSGADIMSKGVQIS